MKEMFLVVHGELLMDQSALTGESLPVKKHNGDEILSGAICKEGEAEAISSFSIDFLHLFADFLVLFSHWHGKIFVYGQNNRSS